MEAEGICVKQRGRLRIFFSYADGCGKLRRMVESAANAARRGADVRIGVKGGQDWMAAVRAGVDIEAIAPRRVGSALEFDLDAALKSGAQLIVLGGMAHQNAGACRHEMRYQDVRELLNAGIDVYTTLNVDQLDGMRDAVRALTGAQPGRCVPDAAFDAADEVEFVDLPPSEVEIGAGRPLAELREMALRRCTDRVALASGDAAERAPATEHILVCISPAPSNARVIRMAVRMANAFRCVCTAIFVRNPGASALRGEDRARLEGNLKLAEQLGARLELLSGEDVALQIAEYARLSGATKIVLGRSAAGRRGPLSKPTITDRLIQLAPGIEIHILPDGAARESVRHRLSRFNLRRPSAKDWLRALAILALASGLSLIFYALGFSEANIIMAYILGVMLTAVTTSSRLISGVSSIASVFIFNYLFTEPRFTLNAYGAGYPVTFLIMLIAALLTGTLAAQLRDHTREAVQAAYRTRILFETNQQLSNAPDRDAILALTAEQLVKLFKRDVIVYPVGDGALGEGRICAARADGDAESLSGERKVAEWVLQNNRQAGAATDTFAQARGLYLAIRIEERIFGVVGVAMDGQSMDAAAHSMLLAILGECALALENEKNVREKEAAAMQVRSEQLRANLLRAISHDLRTPLTAISGNASNLLSNGAALDEATRQQIYADIRDDALWLINLVENLLYVTRIEDGRMRLRCSVELIDEVLQEALRHESCKGRDHLISLRQSGELLFANIDARLIIQVVINLVDNALKYTPPGARIELSARREGAWIYISCADDGPGVPDADKPHIFEMFYSGHSHCADSRRSLGLGLGLCKSIVSAHGGEIAVRDNQPKGAIFEFSVPAEEVHLNE